MPQSPRRARRRATGSLLATLLAAGCVPLTPYREIRLQLPTDRLVEVDGRPVHVVQRGEGEPLVLLHGFGASTYSWRLVVPELAERYRTVAIDLNGFGFSQRPAEAAAYTVAGQLATVLAVLDELGIDSAHLAGHSYGGALSLHLAWRHPERVRSLILIDSAGPEYPWERRYPLAAVRPLISAFVRVYGLRRSSVRKGLERSFADDGQVTEELIDAYFERVKVSGAGRAYYHLSAPTREPRELPVLERLAVPTLVVWGSEDVLIGPEYGRQAAERIPAAEFRLIEGAGHIPLEEAPDRLAGLMLEFLDRQPSAAPRATTGR